MKFLVDANLPFKLCAWLKSVDIDAIHTDHLPSKENSTDTEIRNVALHESRTVITKDTDFYYSCLLNHSPDKLLLITTGNLTNQDLLQLFSDNIHQIISLLENHDIIELDNTSIIIHHQ